HLVSNESVGNEWKIQNISKFFEILKRFEKETENPSVYQFLDYLDYSLEIGENPATEVWDIDDVNAVNILTVHGSKGLEFPVVFMVNLVSDRFPSRNRSEVVPIPDGLIKETLPEGDEHIQEERRLFYVGVTRAEDIIYLTSADYYGDGIRKKKQSIFLNDVDLVVDERSLLEKENKLPFGVYGVQDSEDIEVPEDVRKIFVSNLEKNLSYSHISSFQKCPYQFYFKYVLEIPGTESQARSFGMTIHNTLKEFYERVRSAKQGFSKISKIPKFEDLVGIYQIKWQSGGYENQRQEKERRESGKQALKHFYKKFFDEDQEPLLLEHRFRVPMGDFWLKGTIDRVDSTKDGIEIIDYKTGRIPSDENHIKKDLQLPTYVLAMERMQEKKIHQVSLLYVEEGEKISTKISKEAKEKSVEEIMGCLEEIKKVKFPPKPGPLCKFCDYKNVCNYANID
ncbi:MAG: PD-(D/E)XK nuclease family protein, partial [bacterium]